MLGKEWNSLLTFIQNISAAVSLFLNSFLIFLIVKKSPKQLGPYRWLMIYISVFELLYSILDVVLAPQHYSHGPIFLTIVGTENKLFHRPTLTILNACYWGCFGASMAVFAVHFVYRYLVLSGHRLRLTFYGCKIWFWFSIPVWYAAVWYCTGYFLAEPNEATTRFIRRIHCLGPYLYETTTDGNIKVSSIIFIVLFATLCYIRISDLVVTTIISARIRSLQRQLFYALVIQTLVPLILMHIPAAIMFAFVFLNIDLGVYSAIVSMTIALYPAVDPIPTMVIVKNYRRTILKYLGLGKTKISAESQKRFDPTELQMKF
ncbi:Protein CBG01179 [Caenorhabditis briggsae]|uniref:Protein CBG01179 n=1 Tax=Caenorhabditis briggsae TaxID=6238 RepID=A8WPS0_CAEBR|nr:Protein CBG01179 [Caenorhabditis briggsae]CAP22477.2 Protein CBG01179 [Caenorhabditis briggsae]